MKFGEDMFQIIFHLLHVIPTDASLPLIPVPWHEKYEIAVYTNIIFEINDSKKHKQTSCGSKTTTYMVPYYIHGTNSKQYFLLKNIYIIGKGVANVLCAQPFCNKAKKTNPKP